MSIYFLTVDDVLAIHEMHLEKFGGLAGIRDLGLLASAVSQASVSFNVAYLQEDLAEMAAACLFSIVKNHPFVDGNKRTGLASALTFLDLNGIAIDHSSGLLYDATMAVAEGQFEKGDLAALLRQLSS